MQVAPETGGRAGSVTATPVPGRVSDLGLCAKYGGPGEREPTPSTLSPSVHRATMTITFAIIRPPSPSFVDAIGQVEGAAPIDLMAALHQHKAYQKVLESLGCQVIRLPMDDRFPDACFVEDTAVIIGDAALVTVPGAESRRGEAAKIAWTLGNLADGALSLTQMELPATLDGGDVLRLGDTFYVGLSSRTNQAGLDVLTSIAVPRGYRVVPVTVPGGVLHLKSHATALDAETLLCAPGWLPEATGVRRVEVPAEELYAANALAIGKDVLVSANHPRTAELIAAAGFNPIAVINHEFAKAAGSLTCLSILVELPTPPGVPDDDGA